jgi:1-pyrroline-5-carboxylate dehydrogenase
MNAKLTVPPPHNEPVLSFAPGSPEKASLKAKLAEMSSSVLEIPLIIGGKEVRTGNTTTQVMPHNHQHVLATVHKAGAEETKMAVEAAAEAQKEWAHWPWEDRAAVFLKAAELLAGPWRDTLNAATMLGQSKTAHQAEIDAACELIDFYRFNAAYAQQIYEDQPASSPGVWNYMDYRPLEGFVYAISPFNFSSIGGNLAGAPALMGNTVLWKPAHTAIISGYYIARLLEEAGLPPGVINFIPGKSSEISSVALFHQSLSGIHFTGSTGVFQYLWRTVGENIASYASYPRVVGETGGKDFLIAHPSADPDAVKTAIIRGGFEYQGQKCSALSRAYIPESMWEVMGAALIEDVEGIKMGDPADFTNFMGAVIEGPAYEDITGYIKQAADSSDAEIIAGGQYDDSEGFFIRPTVIKATDPKFVTMCDEIFGPVVTIYVYKDSEWEETLGLVDSTSPYALTGAVFSRDRGPVLEAHRALRFAAGNFYVNDKPTGAVVGQQPFGGARASGTNDKAGSYLNLLRWVNARTVKETFVPPRDYPYPFMGEE